jgi:2-alkenal reductase
MSTKRTGWIALLTAFAVVLIGAGFFIGSTTATYNALSFESNVAVLRAQEPYQPLLESEAVYANIYNQVSPSVVSINVVGSAASQMDPEGLLEGTGTGFVIDQSGHIVTNSHVVEGANRIEINFFDGTIVRGEVVGLDPDSDIAVLRVALPVEQLRPVQFADSDTLFIGQHTVAIGSPFGQRWTMTTGIISALDRTIQGLSGFNIGAVIQTDAAINPGNSGGPLLDLQGRVIGVNSQIVSRSRSNSGIGFAVPSNLVQRVAQSLIDNGSVNYSYLGIRSRPGDVDLAMIETLGLPNNTRGVVVQGVEPAGPAARAGLRDAGNVVVVDGFEVPQSVDIITAIDGQIITGFNQLIAYLASNTQPGQTVTLTVLREGQSIQLPLTLGERPRFSQ